MTEMLFCWNVFALVSNNFEPALQASKKQLLFSFGMCILIVSHIRSLPQTKSLCTSALCSDSFIYLSPTPSRTALLDDLTLLRQAFLIRRGMGHSSSGRLLDGNATVA
jgi:hypothetical protein